MTESIGAQSWARALVYAILATVAAWHRYVVIPVLYALATVAMLWPLVSHPRSAVADSESDPQRNAWALRWVQHSPITHPLDLYDANLFAPNLHALAFSEALLLQAVMAWPLWLIFHDALLSYNVILLLTYPMCAMAKYALCRSLGAVRGAAVVVELCYAVSTMTTREHQRRDVARPAGKIALPPAVTLVATFAIFGPEFFFAFRRATSKNFLSANALTFHWIVTQALVRWEPLRFSFGPNTHRQFIRIPSATLLALVKLPFVAIYLGVLTRFAKGPRTYATMLHDAYIGYITYVLLNTSVPENHLVPAVVLAGRLWVIERRYGPLFLITAVMMTLNLLLFYRLDGFARLPVIVHGLNVSLPLATLDKRAFASAALAPRAHPLQGSAQVRSPIMVASTDACIGLAWA